MEREIILRVDNDPSHDVEYAVLKLKCDKLEMHPLFLEVKSYELLDNKNMLQGWILYKREKILLEIIMNLESYIHQMGR